MNCFLSFSYNTVLVMAKIVLSLRHDTNGGEKILSKEKEALEAVCETSPLLFRRYTALAGLLADLICPTGDACI